ncbi:MAG: aminotransferase class IV [Eubacterium sp.]|nr:aminotransferase class IV [Eubacterium sp.]
MNIAFDEGYTFGLGAFETISVIKKKPILLDSHLARLNKALDFLNIQNRPDKVSIFKWIDEAELSHRAVLKLMVSENNILKSFRENPYTEADYAKGFAVCLSPVRRNETSPLVFHKTFNYGDNILEKRRAKAQGFDEPLFLNTRGEIAEGATTNVFVVKDGQIFTPPIAAGLLPGTLRGWVLEHFAVKEKTLCPEDLLCADEIFLTNALLGVMGVRRFEAQNFMLGSVSGEIRAAYEGFYSKS